jgi:hypothetical protein
LSLAYLSIMPASGVSYGKTISQQLRLMLCDPQRERRCGARRRKTNREVELLAGLACWLSASVQRADVWPLPYRMSKYRGCRPDADGSNYGG